MPAIKGRYRKWMAEEVPRNGTTIKRKDDGSEHTIMDVIYSRTDGTKVKLSEALNGTSETWWISAQAIFDEYVMRDGSACGVENK